MLSRSIHRTGLIDLEDRQMEIHGVLDRFRIIGYDGLVLSIGTLTEFDPCMLRTFYGGIRTTRLRQRRNAKRRRSD